MKRADLEHIIRAAGSIADSRKLIIIGSQAILGSFPDPPAELTASQKADTYPMEAPEKPIELKEPQITLAKARLERCRRGYSRNRR